MTFHLDAPICYDGLDKRLQASFFLENFCILMFFDRTPSFLVLSLQKYVVPKLAQIEAQTRHIALQYALLWWITLVSECSRTACFFQTY